LVGILVELIGLASAIGVTGIIYYILWVRRRARLVQSDFTMRFFPAFGCFEFQGAETRTPKVTFASSGYPLCEKVKLRFDSVSNDEVGGFVLKHFSGLEQFDAERGISVIKISGRICREASIQVMFDVATPQTAVYLSRLSGLMEELHRFGEVNISLSRMPESSRLRLNVYPVDRKNCSC
jgi:hypothetical protein